MDVRCPTSDPETVSTTSINNGQLARSTEKHEANAAFNDSASNSFWKTADVKEEGRQAVKRPHHTMRRPLRSWAAPEGERRPCSHSCNVRLEMLKAAANSACDRPVPWRTSVTSFGATSVVRVADLRFCPTLHGFRHTAPVGVKTIQMGRWWGQLVSQK